MMLSEYTTTRADKLDKLILPEFAVPYRIKILWIRIFKSTDPGRAIFSDTHKHSFYESHFVLDGSICYENEGTPFHVPAGQGLLIGPGIPHIHMSSETYFLKANIAFTVAEHSPLDTYLSQKAIQEFPLSPIFTDCFNVILREIDENSSFSLPVIQNRILEVIYAMSKTLVFDSLGNTSRSETKDARFSVAQNYILKHLGEPITCDDVARECGLSAKQLNRIFLKDTNKGLYDYITQVRLNRAEELLLNTTLSMKEISSLLGFENEYAFNSFFKRHCGIPPGQFRKLNVK